MSIDGSSVEPDFSKIKEAILKSLKSGLNGTRNRAELVTLLTKLQDTFPDITPAKLLESVHQVVRQLYDEGSITIAERGWRWIYWEYDVKELEKIAISRLNKFVIWNEASFSWKWNEVDGTYSVVFLFLRPKGLLKWAIASLH